MNGLLAQEAEGLDLATPLAHFAAHGWARLPRVLSEAGAAILRARTDEIMLGERVYDGLFFQHDSPSGDYDDLEYGRGWIGPSLAYRKLEKVERDPYFRAWIENPVFRAITRALVGPDVSLYRAVLFNKSAAGGTALPWHQDGGRFWGVDRAPTLQIWTALDDTPVESGCVEVMPGTHAGGLVTPEGGSVPAKFLAAQPPDGRALLVPARAGEALLIHNHLWHRSGRNTTGAPRRALTCCFMDAATRCLRTKHAPRQFVRLWGSC